MVSSTRCAKIILIIYGTGSPSQPTEHRKHLIIDKRALPPIIVPIFSNENSFWWWSLSQTPKQKSTPMIKFSLQPAEEKQHIKEQLGSKFNRMHRIHFIRPNQPDWTKTSSRLSRTERRDSATMYYEENWKIVIPTLHTLHWKGKNTLTGWSNWYIERIVTTSEDSIWLDWCLYSFGEIAFNHETFKLWN